MWVVALLTLSMTQPLRRCVELMGAARGATPAAVVPAAIVPAAPIAVPTPPRPVPPALALAEHSRYRVDYGVLEIGALELVIAAATPGASLVHADGHGAGGLLGLGHMENRIATDFDLSRLESRRWDNARSGGEGDLRDRAEQTAAGQVSLVRERPGDTHAPVPTRATLAAPLLDPLGFLLRLRVEPPGSRPGDPPQILYVLDGQALWRVTITNAGRGPAPEGIVADVPTLRLEVEAEPIRWDGVADVGERAHRSLKLWLSDDAARVPLRLEVHVGIANVVVALTDIDRRPALVR